MGSDTDFPTWSAQAVAPASLSVSNSSVTEGSSGTVDLNFSVVRSGQGGFIGGVAAGDFNGDGHLDLAVGIGVSQTIFLLLGDGNGGFGTPTGVVFGQNLQGILSGSIWCQVTTTPMANPILRWSPRLPGSRSC